MTARGPSGIQTGTPGGARLRVAREEAGRTQLWVELEAGLGTGYLQRLESGRVVQPERATLDRILTALDASYNARHEVMQLFGYTVPTEPPNADETRWARELALPQIADFPFPAYALDCLHRLVVWNDGLPRLLGLAPDDPRLLALDGSSMLAPWFDAESLLGALVVEPDTVLPALVRAFLYEWRRFRDEPWSAEVLRSLRRLPRFEQHWIAVQRQAPPVSAARALVPLRLRASDGAILSFRLSSEPFLADARFRLVYYFPDDIPTMRHCREWRSPGESGRAESPTSD